MSRDQKSSGKMDPSSKNGSSETVEPSTDQEVEASGGRVSEGEAVSNFGSDGQETLESLVERVKSHPDSDRSGAISTFTGRVRVKDSDDDVETTELEFDRYEGLAEEKAREISRELEDRDGVFRVLMHHKVGEVEAEEDIVHVVVLAGHRREAFDTVEDGINRLKDRVPIFKKEVTTQGEVWDHEK
ncbi:MAG: molybdopterin synthase [Halobacteria archaeon]